MVDGWPRSLPRPMYGKQSKYDFVKVRVWLGAPPSTSSSSSSVSAAASGSSTSTPATENCRRSSSSSSSSSSPPSVSSSSSPLAPPAAAAAHPPLPHRHYYVLSRFLVSRTLTSILIPPPDAVALSLELKKQLVDSDRFDIDQQDLESQLFALMRSKGYGRRYEESYRAMTTFHHDRTPLLVLVGGGYCTGKSTLASKLAQRMNLPNVLQTDMLADLLRDTTGDDGDDEEEEQRMIRAKPLWSMMPSDAEVKADSAGTGSSSPTVNRASGETALITAFRSESEVVLRGLAGNIEKAVLEGKSIIIEGIHLDVRAILQYIDELCARGDGNGNRRSGDNVIVVPILLRANYYPTGDGCVEHNDGIVEKWMETREAEMAAFKGQMPSKDQIVVRRVSPIYSCQPARALMFLTHRTIITSRDVSVRPSFVRCALLRSLASIEASHVDLMCMYIYIYICVRVYGCMK